MIKPILLPAKDYLDDVTACIQSATHRVFITGLVIDNDSAMHGLIEAILSATRRGIEVNIAIDTFTFSEFGGYFSPFKRYHARSLAAARLAKRLSDAGVTFHWLGGNYKINPFSGVTHIKWIIVDNVTYTFGGVNLYARAFHHTDYMLKISDNTLANSLVHEQLEIIKADTTPTSYKGSSFSTMHGKVYVDSGKRGESLIYERACSLAQEAKHVTFISQYCPGERLTRILKTKKTAIYYNQPRNIKNFYSRVFVGFAQWRYKLHSLYRRTTYLHAKCMLFEMENGEKIALTGSHNFSQAGVSFGTREVAIETNNTTIHNQIEIFFKENIKD